MPPWFADPAHGTFKNDARLTEQQIDTIVKWVDAGAPRGNPADEPKPPALTEGWQLGEPDFVITLPTVNVPAEGNDIFPTPNLTIDIPEDRWVRAVEIRPSNREVTHHSVLFMAGGLGGGMVGQSGFVDVLGVWAVGTPPTVYPEGVGRWIRKGAQLRTNLHYHPNGKAQTDTTRVGLYFGRGELKKEVASAVAGDVSFKIPAGAKNHEMRALYVIDQDVNIVSYFPHMHFRGKDMTLTATLPGGRKQTLLSVPNYDFNWQLYYYPQNPVPLPRGTIIEAVAHYDNSADNPNNPDPTKDVTFGEQSTNEMMFGVFDFTPKDGVSPVPTTVDKRMDVLASTLAGRLHLHDERHDPEADTGGAAPAAHRRRHVLSRPGPLPDQRHSDQEHRVDGRQLRVPHGRALRPERGVHLRREGQRHRRRRSRRGHAGWRREGPIQP